MPREIPQPPRANRKGMSNLSMSPVRRVPSPKFQSRPFKLTFPRRQPRVNSLQHPDLPPFKAMMNGPQKKVPVSQPRFAECKPLHLLRLPTPMTNALQRPLLLCRRPLRPRLAICKPVAISLLQPGFRKTRYRLQPQPRRHRPPQVLLFRILFHPSQSFPASALFEEHPTPRAPSARTFRLAA